MFGFVIVINHNRPRDAQGLLLDTLIEIWSGTANEERTWAQSNARDHGWSFIVAPRLCLVFGFDIVVDHNQPRDAQSLLTIQYTRWKNDTKTWWECQAAQHSSRPGTKASGLSGKCSCGLSSCIVKLCEWWLYLSDLKPILHAPSIVGDADFANPFSHIARIIRKTWFY